jgi:flagellar P-ring protein precursor FlgI
VRIAVPQDRRERVMEFIAEVEKIEFQPSRVAKVVLNEKTGTIIAGGEVTISEVAVAHGSITVEINTSQETQLQTGAAPGAVTQQSATNIREQVKVSEPRADLRVLPASASVAELARSLNALGVSPRDVIAIFEAIKKAGALNAELVVM